MPDKKDKKNLVMITLTLEKQGSMKEALSALELLEKVAKERGFHLTYCSTAGDK